MSKYQIIATSMLLGVSIFGTACMDLFHRKAKGPDTREIALMQQKVKENPNDAAAIQALGIMYYQVQEYEKSLALLSRANSLSSPEPRTIRYLGMSYAMSSQTDLAIKTFETYLEQFPNSPNREWVEGRLKLLFRQRIKTDMARLVQQETQLDSQRIDSRLVIIYPFVFHGDDKTYAALAKGLTETMMNDLRPVEGIGIINRVQVEALLSEIAKQGNGLESQANTRRIGQLLGVGTILRVDFNVLNGEQIIMDVAYWDVKEGGIPNSVTHVERLENLFKLQSQIALELLNRLSLPVTPELEALISEAPTPSLKAFLAYSVGLEKEDAGDYQDAVVFYSKALELDPRFRECAFRMEENKGLLISPVEDENAGELNAIHYPGNISTARYK